MHWLGTYKVKVITDGGDVQLRDLECVDLRGMINKGLLKLYKDSQPPTV
jgi:hypothetical protein